MRVESKDEFYAMYRRGLFGNKLSTWPSYTCLMASNYRGHVSIRYRGITAGQFAAYDIPRSAVALEVQKLVAAGAQEERLTFNETAPDDKLLLQGELQRSERYLTLFVSREKQMMRHALLHNGDPTRQIESFEGLAAVMLLRHTLDGNSYEDLQTLLDLYPDAVIEFATYAVLVGDCPGRNTLIFEVRNY